MRDELWKWILALTLGARGGGGENTPLHWGPMGLQGEFNTPLLNEPLANSGGSWNPNWERLPQLSVENTVILLVTVGGGTKPLLKEPCCRLALSQIWVVWKLHIASLFFVFVTHVEIPFMNRSTTGETLGFHGTLVETPRWPHRGLYVCPALDAVTFSTMEINLFLAAQKRSKPFK